MITTINQLENFTKKELLLSPIIFNFQSWKNKFTELKITYQKGTSSYRWELQSNWFFYKTEWKTKKILIKRIKKIIHQYLKGIKIDKQLSILN